MKLLKQNQKQYSYLFISKLLYSTDCMPTKINSLIYNLLTKHIKKKQCTCFVLIIACLIREKKTVQTNFFNYLTNSYKETEIIKSQIKYNKKISIFSIDETSLKFCISIKQISQNFDHKLLALTFVKRTAYNKRLYLSHIH